MGPFAPGVWHPETLSRTQSKLSRSRNHSASWLRSLRNFTRCQAWIASKDSRFLSPFVLILSKLLPY